MENRNHVEFICDSMFGKLAKWLRMAGYSAVYLNGYERKSFIDNLHPAPDQILITGDRKITGSGSNAFFLDEIYVAKQFDVIKEKFKLDYKNAFSLCMECNYPLKPAEKEKNREKIPDYVYKNFNEFKVCEKCGRIYWQGSHYQEMMKKLK